MKQWPRRTVRAPSGSVEGALVSSARFDIEVRPRTTILWSRWVQVCCCRHADCFYGRVHGTGCIAIAVRIINVGGAQTVSHESVRRRHGRRDNNFPSK